MIGVRRASFFLLLALFATSGVLAAAALVPASGGDARAAASPTTTYVEGEPRAKRRPKPRPRPATIAPRVRIAGIRVGGLTPRAAERRVRARLARPLPVVVGTYRVRVRPAKLGLVSYVKSAVFRARKAKAGARVKLLSDVRFHVLEAWVERVSEHVRREPRNSEMWIRNLAPYISKGRSGRDVDRLVAAKRIAFALRHNQRRLVRLPLRVLRQEVTAASFGAIVVIRRESKRLYLYHGTRLRRVFGIATGQSSYPTPLGHYSIAVKWRDPWWYPPASDWAKGLKPVPPGPGNPLGTRWMGLTAPNIGIHGTPDAASIGYSASHGCIRMYVPEAEWLFERVEIGTPVFILSA